QGLHGSSNYVARYLADWPEPTDPEQKALPRAFQRGTGPLQRQRGYERFSTYFNFDNGTGRIRGIYAQENHAAVPVFKAWLEPFHDLFDNGTGRIRGIYAQENHAAVPVFKA